MSTDNRTNGQIVAKALVAHCEEHKMPFPRGSVKKIVEALQDAGRLAGEPTETEVEAATEIERYRDAAEGNRIRLVHAQNDAERFEAERDAALAAIERVRAIHRPHTYGNGCTVCHWCDTTLAADDSWPCPTVAALDGAPEPEEKP